MAALAKEAWLCSERFSNIQITFPGNKGSAIISEDTRNIVKKTAKTMRLRIISTHLISNIYSGCRYTISEDLINVSV